MFDIKQRRGIDQSYSLSSEPEGKSRCLKVAASG